MDNFLVVGATIAVYSIALVLWDWNAKRLKRSHKKQLKGENPE